MTTNGNEKISKLVQSVEEMIATEGMNPNDFEIVENKEKRTVDVIYLGSDSKITVRGKDKIELREKKLKEFILPIAQRLKEMEVEKKAMKTTANLNYGIGTKKPEPDPMNEELVKAGKDMVRNMVDKEKAEGKSIIYSDTDSVLTVEQAIEHGREILKNIPAEKLEDLKKASRELVTKLGGKSKKQEVKVSQADEVFVERTETLKGHAYRGTVTVQANDNEFDLILTEKDGKKFFVCPCGLPYNQKGHAKWNHNDRHLNKKG